jgi:hypothetical protein
LNDDKRDNAFCGILLLFFLYFFLDIGRSNSLEKAVSVYLFEPDLSKCGVELAEHGRRRRQSSNDVFEFEVDVEEEQQNHCLKRGIYRYRYRL